MKSTSNVNAAQAPSTGALSSRLQVRIRTGQEQARPQLSFQTLFADIKPKAFEEISKSTLARRDEQMRLEKSRREQQPREQDMMAAAAPEPRREPERVQKRDTVAAPPETTATRAAERRTESPHARQDTARPDAPRDAGRDSNPSTAAPGSAPEATGTEDAAAPPHAAENGQPAQQAGLSDAADSGTEASPGSDGLQQVVADALSQIEAEAARAKGDKTQAGGAAATQPTSDAAEDGKAVTGLQAGADAAAEDMGAALTPARAGQTATGATVTAQVGTAAPQTPGDAQAVADGTMRPGAPGALLAAQTGAPGQGNAGQNGPGGKASRHAQQAVAGLQESPSATRTQAATALPSTAAALTANTTAPVTGDALTGAAATGMSRADGAPAGVGVALPVAGSHSPVRADGSPLISSRIDSPINSTEFKEQFARQLAGLVVQGQDRAEIRLTPAELGPIRIRVSLNADDAQLDISAAHASTRAAIESSMSTLRQMLSEQGIRLADYRMDNGQNPAFAQNRQSGQEHSSATQQFGTASGQEGGSAQGEAGQQGRPSTGGPRGTSADRSTEVANRSGGGIRATPATGNGRVDLFA